MNIAVLLFHKVHELDAVGPYSAVNAARRYLDEDAAEALNLYTLAKSRNSVETSGGLVMTPHWGFMSAPEPDVLIVPGGRGVEGAKRDKHLTAYLGERAKGVRLLVSVCTGALLLGELGLLRDKRATTHAGSLERLLDYEVGEIADERVVKNDRLWCAGGVTAGIDAGLEIVRELYGVETAQRAAAGINYPHWEGRNWEG